MRLSTKLFLLVVAITALLLSGCGGHGGGAGGGAGGSAKVTIYWPPRTRVIPDNADSITVTAYTRLRNDITQVLSPIPGVPAQTVNRPSGGFGTTTISFTGDLPQTSDNVDVVLVAQAFTGTNTTALASGSTVISVTAGQTTHFNITLASTIANFKAIVTTGGVVTTYDLSTNPTASIPVDSASSVQFQAFDSGGSQVLLQQNDLTITPTDSLMAEGKQTAAKGSDTVAVAGLHVGTGTLILSYSQTSGTLFSPVTLPFQVNPITKTVTSTFTQTTSEQFSDIASQGSVVYGVFVPTTSSIRALDFSQTTPDFVDAGLTSWTDTGVTRIAVGVGSNVYVGDYGAASLAQLLASSSNGLTITKKVIDLDAKAGTDLYVLTYDSGSANKQQVFAYNSSGNTVASEGFTTTVKSTLGSIAVAKAALATSGSKLSVYISGGNSVKRYLAGVKDTNFAVSLDNPTANVTDIAADGLLLYVLDDSGALTICSWDGQEVGTVNLGSLPGDTVTPLRVAASNGSVYVSYLSVQGVDSFYGVARIQ